MITRPTLLILGAGASMDYGFPSARALKSDICEQFSRPDGDAIKFLCDTQEYFRPYDFVEFCKALQLSGQPSVDAFLERNSDYIEIGKVAIAYCLIPYEDERRLFPPRSDIHLYEYIFSRLGSDITSFGTNHISIITFNYDRSLEHFLATALYNSNRTSSTPEQAQEAVKALPILHLYGQLAPLPWQAREYARLYKPDIRYRDVMSATKFIKIISEKKEAELHKDIDFSRAWELINGAEKICFLGFGYNQTNVQRLKINNLGEPRRIYGTAMGLAESEKKSVRVAFRGITLEAANSLTMLRHYGILTL